jgi:hypothetical protein
MKVPERIKISDRLYHDALVLLYYSIKTDEEVGGFLIKAQHGHLGVVNEQLGEGREIVLEPNEELYEGESYYGTLHAHPVTQWASIGDVSGFLSDPSELVMIVTGSDKSMNIYIKTPASKLGEHRTEIESTYEQDDMPEIANQYGFIFYRAEEADKNVLSLVSDKLAGEPLEGEGEMEIEGFLDALGLEGAPDIPDYSSKKNPIKK